jgi:hypothetical protein
VHALPPPQAFEHLPQLFPSVEVSTHVPLQLVFPAGHSQLPETHVAPPVQALLQRPQLSLSVSVFLQEPLQSD